MRKVGKLWEVAEALFNLADNASAHGEYTRGQALYEEAIVLYRKAGNSLKVGGTIIQSGFWLQFALGDMKVLRQRLQEGQALITRVGDRGWNAACCWFEALLALREGETVRAYDLAQEGLSIYREVGDRWFTAWTLQILGRVEAQRGNLRVARSSYQESLAITQELGEKWITTFNLEGLASIVARQGEFKWAAQLWGAAEALREGMAFPLPPADCAGYEKAVAITRTKLGEHAFAAAWRQGRMMTPEQALAEQKHHSTAEYSSSMPPPMLPAAQIPAYPDGLTRREGEVLRLVASGWSDAQVAEQLVISPRTVNGHLRSIYNKINVNSRSAATRYAMEHALISPASPAKTP